MRIAKLSSPADLTRLYAIAQAVLGVAFMPDAMDEASKKKTEAESAPTG